MRPMPQLEVVEIPIGQLVEYQGNAKLHPHIQVDQIANSIQEFGFNSPILAWHNDQGEPEIVAGHGRLMAARKMGMEKLPVVFLDHMTEEQRRAYILVDNKLTMNSDFDFEILADELGALNSFDMTLNLNVGDSLMKAVQTSSRSSGDKGTRTSFSVSMKERLFTNARMRNSSKAGCPICARGLPCSRGHAPTRCFCERSGLW